MHPMFRSTALITTLCTGALLGACAGMMPTAAPDVPSAIAVPAGNKVAFVYRGSGLLDYECRARTDAPAEFAWVLVSPEAALRDRNDALVGKYYGGPTWEHADGSKVTGKQVAVAPAPTAGNIAWQLVQATPTTGSMVMNGVTYIQRVNTDGGIAPADPCTAATVASRKRVRYSADYYFYKA